MASSSKGETIGFEIWTSIGCTLPLLRGPHEFALKQLALRVINLHCDHLDLHETRMTTAGSLRLRR